MTLLSPTSGDLFRDHLPHRVYKAQRWADEWEEVKYLYANRVYACASPDIPSAELVWRFGEGIQPDKVAFAQYDRLSLLDHYILIEIDQPDDEDGLPQSPISWVGYVLEQSADRGGAFLRHDARVLTGDQAFMAYGLEVQLQQTMLCESWVWQNVGGVKRLVRRPIAFNSEHGFRVGDATNPARGNRTTSKGPDGVYLFSDDLTTAKATTWCTRDIVEYLLEYFSPRATDDTIYVPWALSDRAKDLLPDWDQPVVQCEGRTFKSVLDQLLDRRRLFSWRAVLGEDGEGNQRIELDVFSFNHLIVDLPNGRQQPANEDTLELDFDRAVDVASATLRDSAMHQVEQVRVLGARKRSIFTIAALDETLVEDWDAADATSYSAGPAGVGSLDPGEQEQRVKTFRGSDTFERVFAWFRLPNDWDGYVGNGAGGAKNYFFPDDDTLPANDPRRRERFYMPELRFARHLPRELYPIAPTSSPEEVPPPIALLKAVYDPTGSSPRTYYQHVQRLGELAGVEFTGDGAGQAWGCSLRVQQNAPGIVLRVSGGIGQHAIASADFTPLGIDETPPLNWRDNLLATVMLELDSRVEVAYPAQSELLGQPLDVARVVTIDLGPRARLDWIAQGTVVDHVDGDLYRTPFAGTYLRDDRDMMRDLAQLAFEWYGVKRQAFTFVFRQLSDLLSVGQIVTKIGSGDTEEEVNAAVTGVQWDLVGGRTQVTTDFAELDFVQL